MATGFLGRVALAPPAPVAATGGSFDISQVYAAHFQYVWRCLRGLGVGEHALEDAVQDVFIVVQLKLSGFDGSQALLTTWLYEIALRVGRRYRAQTAKEASRSVSLLPSAPEDDRSCSNAAQLGLPVVAGSTCELEHAERLALALRALDTLDAVKREVFVLACVEQRAAPEIAQLTGVPLNTVYSRLRAARRSFDAEVARLEAVEGRRTR
jgi:RNA polymerase sigma-70 factor, ECF subfamily